MDIDALVKGDGFKAPAVIIGHRAAAADDDQSPRGMVDLGQAQAAVGLGALRVIAVSGDPVPPVTDLSGSGVELAGLAALPGEQPGAGAFQLTSVQCRPPLSSRATTKSGTYSAPSRGNAAESAAGTGCTCRGRCRRTGRAPGVEDVPPVVEAEQCAAQRRVLGGAEQPCRVAGGQPEHFQCADVGVVGGRAEPGGLVRCVGRCFVQDGAGGQVAVLAALAAERLGEQRLGVAEGEVRLPVVAAGLGSADRGG